MNKHRPFWQNTTDPPSILLVTEECRRVVGLRQWLEREGCRVTSVNINHVEEVLHYCRHVSFDVMVLSVETSEMVRSLESYKTLRSLYKNLKIAPALLTLPMVVMTACGQVEAAIKRLAVRPAYFIEQDEAAGPNLLHTIEQIHYLTHRYV